MIIGAQLYTVRDYCKNLSDFSETLKKVADMGYTAVQVSGSCDYDSEWLNEELKKNGLVAPITHFNIDRICNETEKTVKFHNDFGCKYIGIGYYDLSTLDKYNAFVERIKPAAKTIKEKGSLLMYHNHDQEYKVSYNGKTVLDNLLDTFAEDELGITFDVYWAQFAGFDPTKEILKLGSRLKCAHLKDMSKNDDKLLDIVGEGQLNFESILEALNKVHTEYAFVEQDECYGKDPFFCLKQSYDNIKKIL